MSNISEKCSQISLSLCDACLIENGMYAQAIIGPYILNSNSILTISKTPTYKYLRLIDVMGNITCLDKRIYTLDKEFPEVTLNESYIDIFITQLKEQFNTIYYNNKSISNALEKFITEDLVKSTFVKTYVKDTINYYINSDMNYLCKLQKDQNKLLEQLSSEAFLSNLLYEIECHLNGNSEFVKLCKKNGLIYKFKQKDATIEINDRRTLTISLLIAILIIVLVILIIIGSYFYIKAKRKKIKYAPII